MYHITAIKAFINNASLVKGLLPQIEQLSIDSKILHDMTLLNEYIEKMKSQYNNLFPEMIVNDITPANIKPHYAKYHELYGIHLI